MFGEFRTGKTQLCHTLAVTCQVFITTVLFQIVPSVMKTILKPVIYLSLAIKILVILSLSFIIICLDQSSHLLTLESECIFSCQTPFTQAVFLITSLPSTYYTDSPHYGGYLYECPICLAEITATFEVTIVSVSLYEMSYIMLEWSRLIKDML